MQGHAVHFQLMSSQGLVLTIVSRVDCHTETQRLSFEGLHLPCFSLHSKMMIMHLVQIIILVINLKVCVFYLSILKLWALSFFYTSYSHQLLTVNLVSQSI